MFQNGRKLFSPRVNCALKSAFPFPENGYNEGFAEKGVWMPEWLEGMLCDFSTPPRGKLDLKPAFRNTPETLKSKEDVCQRSYPPRWWFSRVLLCL